MTFDRAMVIALNALGHIAGDAPLLDRFCRESGTRPDDLPHSAGEPEFLGGVLDFVLAEDRRLIAFCGAAGLGSEEPAQARAALPGADRGGGT